MSLERIDALRRWSWLVDAAWPGDLAAILAGLPERDLVGLVEAADAPVSLAVCEYVVEHGSSATLVALARRAVLGECDQGERILYPDRFPPEWLWWFRPLRTWKARRTHLISRILRRCDPEVDAAFFDFDDSLRPVADARAAVLSHRRGRRGRAAIPAGVKKRLLDAAAEHAHAHAAHGKPGADGGPGTDGPDAEPRLPPRLASELAIADDPDLVFAVLPYHAQLTDAELALALTTLVSHRRRKELRERYPELWSRFTRTARWGARWSVRQARYPYRGPAGPAVLSLDHFIHQAKARDRRQDKGWLLRGFAMDSLRTGTISPADVVAHARPAAVALTLACWTTHDEPIRGTRRAADDVRILIQEQLTAAAGEDTRRWASLIRHAAGFEGTFPELLAGLDHGFQPQSYPYDERSAYGPWNATNVLFAMAPRSVGEHLLQEEPGPFPGRLLDHLAAGAPLPKHLVKHIIGNGTPEQRAALAHNTATPDAVLSRLLKRKKLVRVIAERRFVAPEIRLAALDRFGLGKSGSTFGHPVHEVTKRGPEPFLSTLRAATDPALLRAVIDIANSGLRPEVRIAAYAILAEAAGPEAVWALELDRAGSLDAMEPEVRASMAAGTAEPLLAAARDSESGLGDPGFGDQAWRADSTLKRPFHRPLETLVRTHLDGRPERWIALVDQMAAEPDAAVQDLVAKLASG